jgi:hypothetical protein
MEGARARVIRRNERRKRGKPDRTIVEEYAQGVHLEADDIDLEPMEELLTRATKHHTIT